MGPIIQERAASTIMKRVVSKEKIRVKNSENSGPNTGLKKGKKMKKAVGQMKSGLPGPGQDQIVATVEQGSQPRSSKLKSGTFRNTNKLASPAEAQDARPQLGQHSSVHRNEERKNHQRMSQCGTELQQNHGGVGKNRRALSLPLSPISGLRHMPEHPLTHSPAPIPEALQDPYKVDDSDSASDLSDSERLPVLPSPCTPCTPPNLNLRAEVINSNDFPLDIPGPHGNGDDEDESETPAHCYPDFLPPPFNTWSLRQLAVFLHTEGRGAPRPKPVGPLERFLERLLQLEWLQIQTVQAESSRPPGRHTRPQAASGHSPRPHTAPSSRLNSPKGPRHSQRAFPYLINPPSPASAAAQVHPLVCPHCHIRYPLCNGSCSAYAYQRHSRLSPLLERKTRPGAPVKRSCSETQEATKEGRNQGAQSGGGAQIPVSPSTGHLRHMHAAGNARKQPQELGSNPNSKGQARKSRVRTNSETDVKKESSVVKAAGAEKHVAGASKKGAITAKKLEDWQRTAAGAQAPKTALKRAAKEPRSLSKAPSSGGKTKNVQSAPK
ncbi:protein FAM217B isoform X2 [Hippocampus comes]|uniref:Protein FAM217B-like n=1 Tax=Hippocampus comes TaxID=109280 RepID=A0A3Q2ZMP5_HIPCM|nr:PREDICTED: protein FAM217B-like isoform X2 [Hippocampus comes]